MEVVNVCSEIITNYEHCTVLKERGVTEYWNRRVCDIEANGPEVER